MAYLVLIDNGSEGVMFENKLDARFAATGKKGGFGRATLADEFREIYAYDEPKKQFRMVEIEVPNSKSGAATDDEATAVPNDQG